LVKTPYNKHTPKTKQQNKTKQKSKKEKKEEKKREKQIEIPNPTSVNFFKKMLLPF
jgi:hypothetical protein